MSPIKNQESDGSYHEFDWSCSFPISELGVITV